MLSEETIEQLKKIMKENYGIELSIQKAMEMANALVSYFDLLAKLDYQNKINMEQDKKINN